jgi:hypothetical protein
MARQSAPASGTSRSSGKARRAPAAPAAGTSRKAGNRQIAARKASRDHHPLPTRAERELAVFEKLDEIQKRNPKRHARLMTLLASLAAEQKADERAAVAKPTREYDRLSQNLETTKRKAKKLDHIEREIVASVVRRMNAERRVTTDARVLEVERIAKLIVSAPHNSTCAISQDFWNDVFWKLDVGTWSQQVLVHVFRALAENLPPDQLEALLSGLRCLLGFWKEFEGGIAHEIRTGEPAPSEGGCAIGYTKGCERELPVVERWLKEAA